MTGIVPAMTTTFWRRQTAAQGNWPAVPAPSTGVPYFPQILPPGYVVGRMPGNAGPTEAIPFSVLAAQIVIANITPRVVTDSVVNILNGDQLVVINKISASPTTVNLPPVANRTQRLLEVYDWTGLAGPMTFNPDAGDSGGIMGETSWQVLSGGVAGSGGSLRLISSPELSGWIVR